MNVENAKRLARSIRRLLSSLDTDAKCYRYQHDPEFEEVKAYLIRKANQLDPDRAIPQAKMDWRERRDALVAEYLERTGGDPRKAADNVMSDFMAMAPAGVPELDLAYLEVFEVLFGMLEDPTGVHLTPSPNGEECLGNGTWPGIERCCDECSFYLTCFSE